MDTTQVAQGPSVTINTPSASSGNIKQRLPALVNTMRAILTELSSVLIVGYLFHEMFSVRHFLGTPNISFWIIGAAVGAVMGLFVIFHLYLSKRQT